MTPPTPPQPDPGYALLPDDVPPWEQEEPGTHRMPDGSVMADAEMLPNPTGGIGVGRAAPTPGLPPWEQPQQTGLTGDITDTELQRPDPTQAFAADVGPAESVPEMTEDMTAEERAQLYQDMRPEDYAAEYTRDEIAKERAQRAAETEVRQKYSEAVEDAEYKQTVARSAHARRQASYMDRLDKLANEREDSNRWWESRSSGQRIAAYVNAIIGGILAPYRGGRNTGLEMIEAEIDRDIAEQRENWQRGMAGLDREGAALQREGAQVDEEFWDAVKVARMKQADDMLAAAQAQLNPENDAAHRVAQARMQTQARMAQADAAAQEAMRKRSMEEAEFASKMRKEQAATAKLEAETAKLRGELGGGSGEAGKGVPGSPQAIEIKGDTLYGLTDAQGNLVPITIKDKTAREDLKGRIRNARAAHRVLTELQKIGGIRRRWKLGELSDADRARAEQLAIGQILVEAKSMGGTITEGDIEFQGKRIPRDPQKLWQNIGTTRALFDGYYDDTLAGLQHELQTVTGRSDLRLGLPAKPAPPTPEERIKKAAAPKVFNPDTGKVDKKTPDQVRAEVSRLPTELQSAVEAGEMTSGEAREQLLEAASAPGLDDEVRAGLRAAAAMFKAPGATLGADPMGRTEQYGQSLKEGYEYGFEKPEDLGDTIKGHPIDREIRRRLTGGEQ